MKSTAMRITSCLLAIGLVMGLSAALAKDPKPPPKPTNGTVAFAIAGADLTSIVKTTLTVKKPARPDGTPKELVNGNPAPNEVDGGHNFPPGTTAAGIGNYYKTLLKNNGWIEGSDFSVSGGVINFFGIEKLDGGTSKGGVKLGGATDSDKIPFNPPRWDKPRKRAKVERNQQRMPGSFTLVAFGVRWNADATISTSTSVATVHFEAQDSADSLMGKVQDALLEAGWEAQALGDGEIEISANSAGDEIYSLYHQIEYYGGEEENDDHWIFTHSPEE